MDYRDNPQHRVPHHIKWTSFAPPGWTNFAPPLTNLIARSNFQDAQSPRETAGFRDSRDRFISERGVNEIGRKPSRLHGGYKSGPKCPSHPSQIDVAQEGLTVSKTVVPLAGTVGSNPDPSQ